MACTVVKCNNCNIVINEVLAFVQNKIDVMTEVHLLSVCTSGFSENEIEEAKSLLYESVPQKMVKRKGDQKTNKNLVDIIALMKETDPDRIPVFVARQLHRLPPVTFNHVDVTRLLKDIVIIQRELSSIQEKYSDTFEGQYATKAEVRQLQFELDELKTASQSNAPYVNTRRGAFCLQDSYDEAMSGPMGLTYDSSAAVSANVIVPPHTRENEVSEPSGTDTDMTKQCLSPSRSHNTATVSLAQPIVEETNRLCPETHKPTQYEASAVMTSRGIAKTTTLVQPSRSLTRDTQPSLPVNKSSKGDRAAGSGSRSYADIARESVDRKQSEKDSEWTLVQHNRHKTRFIGKKGCAVTTPNCKFRAADIKIPLFINNVDKGASLADITTYIREKTQVSVTLEKITMKQEKEYDAYKVYVPKHKLELF